jgi:hypothetical protein
MVHSEFGQDRLTQPHPLKAFELARWVRSKVLSSYFQRSRSGSLGSFCKTILFFAARGGVVKPRQPLRDLNPFDSIFLILRRVVSAPGLLPPRFPSSPRGYHLAACLASALTRPLWNAYSCSVKVPQRWQRNERSQWE